MVAAPFWKLRRQRPQPLFLGVVGYAGSRNQMQIQIRSEQMAEFAVQRIAEANQKLPEYLRRRFPTRLGDKQHSELVEFVLRCRDEAKQYGIEREDCIATYMDLWMMYGAEFAHSDWAIDVMTCDSLHGPDKLAILRHRVAISGVEL